MRCKQCQLDDKHTHEQQQQQKQQQQLQQLEFLSHHDTDTQRMNTRQRDAIITLHPDGSLVLRDIGSSNGTMVNGKEIAIMADRAIAANDEITLGHWTRIKVTAV